ncbi:MAG: hypothetical protein H0W88_10065 [Parachlamydiaceae bacterium]|nr:hypothetical protein [Parachlamydiaceae bacterium]
MQVSFVKRILVFIAVYTGGILMNVSAQSNDHPWITTEDPYEHFHVSFPHHPTHMAFDIPLENTEQLGKLNVYSAPFGNQLLMFCSLYSPTFKGPEATVKQFQEIFYTFIIKRMFYQPKVFKKEAIYSQKNIQFQGMPGIRFELQYNEHGTEKKLSGLATFKDSKIHILFYLAPKGNFDEIILENFIGSFKQP